MDPQLPTTQALPDDSSLFIQSVSWISLLIAGLIVLPVALLLVLDVIVWLWRTYWAHGSPTQDQSECSSAHRLYNGEGLNNFTTGTSTLDYHYRVPSFKGFQSHLDGVGGDVNAANKSNYLPISIGILLCLLHLMVEFSEFIKELLPRCAGFQLPRYKTLNRE
ncbi:unnamed protein product [Parascedosporium putredinis]|uniref:Uncharacterized protein n=1 Tax=Parascedosporium putredinis TaxID=1442378 RepID=A0A9P1MFJ9_9PEZI|nr:unnamed protein product [Parascedosporium putredinis]CAI8003691.1 unnamed protein product [Parascedosporium putredinis]